MINLKQARELLPAAVATQGPDFVYNPDGRSDCLYRPATDDDGRSYPAWPADHPGRTTGCLIGVALDLAGETRHRDSLVDITGLAQQFPDMLSAMAARYFRQAQVVQDQGGSWGYAHDAAEEYLNRSNIDLEVDW